MRSLLPCSKVTLLHRPRMPNTRANALPARMGEDYVVPLGARSFSRQRGEAERRPKRKANLQQQGEGRTGRATGTWRSVTQRVQCCCCWMATQASGKLEQKLDAEYQTSPTHVAAVLHYLRLAFLLPAHCTSKAVGSLRRHPQHHWACVWTGRSP
jgi:hypothetical protein